MGHIARLLEAAGIATVIIAVRAFKDRLTAMTVPRTVISPHLMGRPLGMPGDHAKQRMLILTALDLLEKAQRVGAIVELPAKVRELD